MNKLGFLVSVILALASPGNGIACSCAGRLPTPGAYEMASDVFIATVVDIQRPPSRITHSDGWVGVSPGDGPATVILAVEESLKGVQGSEARLDLGFDTCSYPFVVGDKYLVYADWKDGKLSTDKCKRTRPLSKATPDLSYIRGVSNNESQATLYGNVFREITDTEGKLGYQTPFEELTVILESGDTHLETRAETWGEYELTVKPGEYEVWVEREGKMVSRQKETIVLKENECKQKTLPVKFK